MNERELLIDCLRRLNAIGLAYMLTGSMASNYWGVPRSTHDLDFAIQLPPSGVGKVVEAFSNDFYIDEPAIRAAYQPPYQFNAIDHRSGLKVDFWLPSPKPFEREMFHRRVERSVFDTPAWIATAEDIILHKLYWDRISPSERQQGDAAGVFAVQRDNLDQEYLRTWAQELEVQENLERLFQGVLKSKST